VTFSHFSAVSSVWTAARSRAPSQYSSSFVRRLRFSGALFRRKPTLNISVAFDVDLLLNGPPSFRFPCRLLSWLCFEPSNGDLLYFLLAISCPWGDVRSPLVHSATRSCLFQDSDFRAFVSCVASSSFFTLPSWCVVSDFFPPKSHDLRLCVPQELFM